ncbi:MAG TPA: haloacid dehalogenase type II [Patescibacteria group bacterium]|nr:haloacid dehalogenase type II [Patescibacteria group bacterium]
MATGIGFDVYGTLVDPIGITTELDALAGERAARASQLWRARQLEYSFRRAAMHRYENFDVVTRQALQATCESLAIPLRPADTDRLMSAYERLEVFPDARASLERLRRAGHRLAAFSNGVEATLRRLLAHAGILDLLDDVISVDNVRSFKPDPAVYAHLRRRLGAEVTWLVSSNGWDAIGAKAAGLQAAWVRRDPQAVLDPWGIVPDRIVTDLLQLASTFETGETGTR